jgi:hypothetical protein
MNNKKLTILLIILVSGIALNIGLSYISNPAAPAIHFATIEASGTISDINRNPMKLLIHANSGKYLVLLITSSTEIIRDVGGTVGGTFGFNSLRVGDSVLIKGIMNADDSIQSNFVEQINSQGID